MDFTVHTATPRGVPIRYESACRTCNKIRNYARVNTRKGREAKRQYDREWNTIRRRKKGVQPRPFKKPRVQEKGHLQVLNAPLREAFLKSELTVQEVARRCGWMRDGDPDGLLVKRRLGLIASDGKPYERLSYDNAVTLCKAIDVDPVSVGV